ncbi:MAG TPA: hypothetical protein VGQ81_13195 [Acidobacteriota bacterium]|nr:hypothetical protein [Acidobacteriota bacterium]
MLRLKRFGHLPLVTLLAAVLSLEAGEPQQAPEKPLPELNSFLQGVRKKLHSDRLLLSQYTYNEKVTVERLDKNGKIKDTEVRVYEVYPSLEKRRTYRRLISKNGKPLSAKELEENDKKQQKKTLEGARKANVESAGERQRRLAREAEERRKEEEAIDEAFRMYDIRRLGREVIDGQEVIQFAFTPRPGFKPQTESGKILKKFAGRAWFGERDFELVRIDMRMLEDFSLGWGILARLGKGATVTAQRHRVNDEIWLPASSRFSGNLRVLLFKGIRANVTQEFSDYKKFTVDTSVTFQGVKP